MSTPRLFRCDHAAGPIVALLGPCGDGWVRVRSLLLKLTFETRLDRLYPL